MGSELGVWKTKRYVKGVRARNAGISLTTPEITLIDQECKFVTEKTGKPFTRTALVRYCLEEYFGEEWQGSVRKALHEAAEQIANAPKPPKKPRGGKGPYSGTNGNTEPVPQNDSPEISAGVTESHVCSEPEAASSEAI